MERIETAASPAARRALALRACSRCGARFADAAICPACDAPLTEQAVLALVPRTARLPLGPVPSSIRHACVRCERRSARRGRCSCGGERLDLREPDDAALFVAIRRDRRARRRRTRLLLLAGLALAGLLALL